MKRPYTKHPHGWLDTFLLGARVARTLEPQMTLRQVARELRIPHNTVWLISCTALGKIAQQLEQRGWCA